MRANALGWFILCWVINRGSECMNLKKSYSSNLKNVAVRNILIASPNAEKTENTRRHLSRRYRHPQNVHLEEKRGLDSFMQLGCCKDDNSKWRKDLIVTKPQKIHEGRKIRTVEEFGKILRALYWHHPRKPHAINSKTQLPELYEKNNRGKSSIYKEEDRSEVVKNKNLKGIQNAVLNLQHHPRKSQLKNTKAQIPELYGKNNSGYPSVYNDEDRSEPGKNKTLKELRNAVLSLLEQLKENNSSAKSIQQNTVTHRVVEHKLPQRTDKSSKTASTHPIENDNTESTRPLLEENEISAKRANDLDLMNFISQMKSTEGESGSDIFSQERMQDFNNMGVNRFNSIQNARSMYSPIFSSPMNQMYNPDIFPKNRMRELMENGLPELKDRYKFLEQQQLDSPYAENNLFSKSDVGQYEAIATPESSSIPLGFTGIPMFNNPQIPYQQANPYLSINGPRAPFLSTRDDAFRYALNRGDAAEDTYDDDFGDDGDELEDVPPRYPDDDAEYDDDDDDEEERYGPVDDR
ncbi:uncharacterized protein PF3D7_1120600-like [Montipora capricornis]|uniref:uncharacterized protein PF3D7_1120600-like n=1 Tax=Montipora capricornis TaxID=246305 RepID=UPI0035F1780D